MEKFWVDVEKKPLFQPLSTEAYIEENLILVHLDKVTGQVNHDQLVSLMMLGEVLTKLVATIEAQTPKSEAKTEPEKSPQIELMGRGVVLDLELVPFSSLMTSPGGANHKGVKLVEFIKSNCHLSENLPFSVRSPLLGNGDCGLITNAAKPTELSHSTARLTLTPLVASVRQSETRIMSRLGLESRTFDAPKIERHSLPSLNGSHVMKTFRAPHLLVKMDEKISVTIQNVQLAIINSILADIGLLLKSFSFQKGRCFQPQKGPFFESPIAPATDGDPIEIIIDNVTITLEPDQPAFYPDSILAPLDLCVDSLKLRLNPDGSIAVVKTENTKSLSPRK